MPSPDNIDRNEPVRVSTPKHRRYLAAAALLGGGVTLGAVFSPIGLAGAQTTDSTTTDDGPAAESEPERAHLGHHRGHKLAAVGELLGLTEDELRAEFEAGKSLADIAAEQGISAEELTAAMLAAVDEHLAEAIAEGRIDEAAAAERRAEAEERIPELIERAPGEGGRHNHRHHHRHRHGHGFGEALEELGISAEEIQAGREAGLTLAEVAAEQGVAEDDLVAALVDHAVERVDAAVEAGNLDADRAAEMKENAGERIAELVDREPGDRNGVHRHPHRHGGRDGEGRQGEPGGEGETEGAALTT